MARLKTASEFHPSQFVERIADYFHQVAPNDPVRTIERAITAAGHKAPGASTIEGWLAGRPPLCRDVSALFDAYGYGFLRHYYGIEETSPEAVRDHLAEIRDVLDELIGNLERDMA